MDVMSILIGHEFPYAKMLFIECFHAQRHKHVDVKIQNTNTYLFLSYDSLRWLARKKKTFSFCFLNLLFALPVFFFISIYFTSQNKQPYKKSVWDKVSGWNIMNVIYYNKIENKRMLDFIEIYWESAREREWKMNIHSNI